MAKERKETKKRYQKSECETGGSFPVLSGIWQGKKASKTRKKKKQRAHNKGELSENVWKLQFIKIIFPRSPRGYPFLQVLQIQFIQGYIPAQSSRILPLPIFDQDLAIIICLHLVALEKFLLRFIQKPCLLLQKHIQRNVDIWSKEATMCYLIKAG